MDGKHTIFDLRRRNLDEEYDFPRSTQAGSAEAGLPEDADNQQFDTSFLAERGHFSFCIRPEKSTKG